MDMTELHAADWFTITGRGTVAAITTPHPNPAELKGQTVTIDGKQYRVRGVESFYPRKATSPYGLLVTEVPDTSPPEPTHCNPRNTTAQNTGTNPSPATNGHADAPDDPHAR